ncbi:MAG TPA: hypothetical protein VJ779_17570 [Acetobacteraceae bacterium]|nr:hypothetical protein [Acetobacteraceae bacterium]
MRKILLTTAAMALAAAPAFAATNTPAGPEMNQSGVQSGGGQTSGQNTPIRQQLAQQLSQAGFTDVHVMPESFLVRAKDPQGRPVMMIVNPDSITAVTALGTQGGQMAQGGAQGGQGGASGPMGTSTMTNSAHSGNAINAPNGNGTTTAR